MKEHNIRIPCDENADCPYAQEGGCFEDIHHTYFPKSRYRTSEERRFRNHRLNKILICRAIHDEIHATQPNPEKPTKRQIRAFVAGAEANEKTNIASEPIKIEASDVVEYF